MSKKTLRDYLVENLTEVTSTRIKTFSFGAHGLESYHLVGEYDKSRLFWKYVDDPEALVAFGKIFGGFLVFLKTARTLHTYQMVDIGGKLKCIYMEPHTAYLELFHPVVDMIYQHPSLEDYVMEYIDNRGVLVGTMASVSIVPEMGIDFENLTGTGLVKRVEANADNVPNKTVYHDLYKSKSNILHVGCYADDWYREGWYTETHPLYTKRTCKGSSIYARFNMDRVLYMDAFDIVDHKAIKAHEESVHKGWYGTCVTVLVNQTPEISAEFKDACGTAAARQCLNKILKKDKEA